MLQRFGETAPERDGKFAHVDLESIEADETLSGYASLLNQMHLGPRPVESQAHFAAGQFT